MTDELSQNDIDNLFTGLDDLPSHPSFEDSTLIGPVPEYDPMDILMPKQAHHDFVKKPEINNFQRLPRRHSEININGKIYVHAEGSNVYSLKTPS